MCLVGAMATAVHQRLLYLDHYPELSQAVIDATRAVDREQCIADWRVYKAETALTESMAPPVVQGWPTWQVALVATAGALLATAFGYGLAVVIGHAEPAR